MPRVIWKGAITFGPDPRRWRAGRRLDGRRRLQHGRLGHGWDLQALHRMRQLLMGQRTAVINQVRGILAERGIVVAKRPSSFHRAMPEMLAGEEAELTRYCRDLIIELLEHLGHVEQHIASCDAKVKAFIASNEACKRISAIAGVGPVTATAVVAAVGDASEFANGRHLAAWLGLVPRQHSSGGKSRLGGISKRGNVYLRTLLIHGADVWTQ